MGSRQKRTYIIFMTSFYSLKTYKGGVDVWKSPNLSVLSLCLVPNHFRKLEYFIIWEIRTFQALESFDGAWFSRLKFLQQTKIIYLLVTSSLLTCYSAAHYFVMRLSIISCIILFCMSSDRNLIWNTFSYLCQCVT